MFAAVLVRLVIVTSTGSRRCFWAMRRIGLGSVAEKSAIWRVGWRLLEYPLDVVHEPHLQHLVRLVEHQAGDAAEIQRAALDVVHDAAWRADDHVRAALQAHELRCVALPTIDGQHVESLDLRRVLLERLGDLDRELAGRYEHDALWRTDPNLDAAQDRQREGGRLAGAGLGLAEHVVAGQQHGDRGRLDRRRRFVADVRDGLEDRGAEAEIAKAYGHRFASRMFHCDVLGVDGWRAAQCDKTTPSGWT